MEGFQREISLCLRSATAFALDPELVDECSRSQPAEPTTGGRDPELDRLEGQFRTAVASSLASLPRGQRTNRLNGITGHVAESVAAALLADEFGYIPLQQMVGPESGGHGVDLVVMAPDHSAILTVEVKGTLQQRRWPRLTAGEVAQMSSAWLDKDDNPGMDDHDLLAADVYGAVILVNFARLQWKCAVTADFTTAHPVATFEDLEDLSWLVGESSEG